MIPRVLSSQRQPLRSCRRLGGMRARILAALAVALTLGGCAPTAVPTPAPSDGTQAQILQELRRQNLILENAQRRAATCPQPGTPGTFYWTDASGGIHSC